MEYIFQDTENKTELNRLRSIEMIFDPMTRRRLISAGLKQGSTCLEVGAGAGSVMAWMATEAGQSGSVTAVDINTRFLNDPPSNVKIVPGDIRNLSLEPESFDLVHTRYVLVHIPESQTVLESLWNAVKPGGRVVIEEPDFSFFRAINGEDEGIRSFQKVHQASLHMFSSRGVDYAFGTKLPSLLRKLRARNLVIENDCPISQGGDGIATMMGVSVAQLREKYIATGEATEEDIKNYGAFTGSRNSWAIYYATIGAIGQK